MAGPTYRVDRDRASLELASPVDGDQALPIGLVANAADREIDFLQSRGAEGHQFRRP